jgi:hypothetical protein
MWSERCKLAFPAGGTRGNPPASAFMRRPLAAETEKKPVRPVSGRKQCKVDQGRETVVLAGEIGDRIGSMSPDSNEESSMTDAGRCKNG